jgi:hypothetical protein
VRERLATLNAEKQELRQEVIAFVLTFPGGSPKISARPLAAESERLIPRVQRVVPKVVDFRLPGHQLVTISRLPARKLAENCNVISWARTLFGVKQHNQLSLSLAATVKVEADPPIIKNHPSLVPLCLSQLFLKQEPHHSQKLS